MGCIATAATAALSAAEPPPRELTLRAEVRPLRVLLAEDNLVNQKLATELLKRRGHSVSVVGTGAQAVRAATSQPFDVVLMDVQMPEMDGMEAAAAIRRAESGTGCHVRNVAMTAHAMAGDREKCLAAGMDGFLSKTIHPAELLGVLEQAGADAFYP